MDTNKFGEYLRKARIEREFTLREFARLLDMDVGNLSKIEKGSLNPPKKETLKLIAKYLKLTKTQEQKLFDLSTHNVGKYPQDVSDRLKKYEYIPVLLRSIANKKLTAEQIRDLTKRINSYK